MGIFSGKTKIIDTTTKRNINGKNETLIKLPINQNKPAKIHVLYNSIIIYSNKSFTRISGFNKNDIINKSISLFMPNNIIKSHMYTFNFLEQIESDKRIHYIHKMIISFLYNNKMEKVLINVNPLTFYMVVTFKLVDIYTLEDLK